MTYKSHKQWEMQTTPYLRNIWLTSNAWVMSPARVNQRIATVFVDCKDPNVPQIPYVVIKLSSAYTGPFLLGDPEVELR